MNWKIVLGLLSSLFIFGGEGFPFPLGMVASFPGFISHTVSDFEGVMVRINFVLSILCIAILVFGDFIKNSYFPVIIIITQACLVVGLVIISKGNSFTLATATLPLIFTAWGVLGWKPKRIIEKPKLVEEPNLQTHTPSSDIDVY